MRVKGFTLVELMVAMGIGLLVAAASMSALRVAVHTDQTARETNNSDWVHQANRLLIRDLDQASSITVNSDSLTIDTLSTMDPDAPGYSPTSIVEYTAVDASGGLWWVREESAHRARTNAQPEVLLLGPAQAELVLHVRAGSEASFNISSESVAGDKQRGLTQGPFTGAFRIVRGEDETR